MAQTTERRLIIVVRQTRLDELVARFNTIGQARFYIESLGADFSDYVTEHEAYRTALQQTDDALREIGRVHRLQRAHLPNYLFGATDIVVVLGQDGLVANTLKYLDGQAVVGVNPDPARWDGVLLPFTPKDVGAVVRDHLVERRQMKEIVMARAALNDGQELFAVNDLFIGPRSHVSARYVLALGQQEERQSSSGIIVSTGLGSTGWMRSVYAGWAGMNAVLMGTKSQVESRFAWDAAELRFCVREPFPSRTSQTDLVFGRVTGADTLRITSLMPENGTIFSDGIEADCLGFNSGAIATIGVANRRGLIVM